MGVGLLSLIITTVIKGENEEEEDKVDEVEDKDEKFRERYVESIGAF